MNTTEEYRNATDHFMDYTNSPHSPQKTSFPLASQIIFSEPPFTIRGHHRPSHVQLAAGPCPEPRCSVYRGHSPGGLVHLILEPQELRKSFSATFSSVIDAPVASVASEIGWIGSPHKIRVVCVCVCVCRLCPVAINLFFIFCIPCLSPLPAEPLVTACHNGVPLDTIFRDQGPGIALESPSNSS
jgi:hypothetical protein